MSNSNYQCAGVAEEMEEWRRETEFGSEIRRRREGTVDMKKISDT